METSTKYLNVHFREPELTSPTGCSSHLLVASAFCFQHLLNKEDSSSPTKTWRRHEVALPEAKHPAIRLTCRSLHLQPRCMNKVAGAVRAACAWKGFNIDGLSPSGDMDEALATFFILHLPLQNHKETRRGEQAPSSPNMLASSIWTYTFDWGSQKTSHCKGRFSYLLGLRPHNSRISGS